MNSLLNRYNVDFSIDEVAHPADGSGGYEYEKSLRSYIFDEDLEIPDLLEKIARLFPNLQIRPFDEALRPARLAQACVIIREE
jgi:hypothetical protein